MTVTLTPAAQTFVDKYRNAGRPGVDPAAMRHDWARLTPADHRALRQQSAQQFGRVAKEAMSSSDPTMRKWGEGVRDILNKGMLPAGMAGRPIHIDTGADASPASGAPGSAGMLGMVAGGWGPK